MSFIWKKDGFSLEYSNPKLTAFPEQDKAIQSIDDALYFYYTLTVRIDEDIVCKFDSYDEHKVDALPISITKLINTDMNKGLLLYEENQEHRELYNRIDLDSYYDLEYFFTLERFQYQFKDRSKHPGVNSIEDIPFTVNDLYSIHIGEGEPNKKGYSTREDYGKSVYIKNIHEHELLELKKVAENFIQYAIDKANENTHSVCDDCGEKFIIADNTTEHEDFKILKCPVCGHDKYFFSIYNTKEI